ncbi:MAG: glycosyltransferase family 39 protein, partial [Chloroflexota bacterium]
MLLQDLKRKEYAWLSLITLLGAALRFHNITLKSLWFDEAVVYWISQGTIGQVVKQNAGRNSSPFLHVLLLNIATKFSDSELLLRGISAVAGILTIPLIYWLARQFLSRDSALAVALIAAISKAQVQYSQQLREYSIAFLLAIAILITFHLYQKKSTKIHWLSLVAVWTLSVTVQYGLSVLIVALNLIFLLNWVLAKEEIKQILYWAAGQLFVLGAMFVVYYFALRHQLQIGFGASAVNSYLQSAYWDGTLAGFARLLFINTFDILEFSFPFGFGRPWVSFLFIGFIFAGIYAAVRQKKSQLLMILVTPLMLTFTLAIARLYPYHGERQ